MRSAPETHQPHLAGNDTPARERPERAGTRWGPLKEGAARLRILSTGAIVVFWIAMNTAVVLSHKNLQQLDRYRRGVTEFLGSELSRERWMGVYRDDRKIGYTGLVIERVATDEGSEVHVRLESVFDFDLFGVGERLFFRAELVQDEALKPLRLDGEVRLVSQAGIRLSGARHGEHFIVEVTQGDEQLLELPLPAEELFLADGLTPSLPLGGYEIGERLEVACLDPITLRREKVIVEVTDLSSRQLQGLQMDVYTLTSKFRGMTSTTMVSRDGLVLSQEFGPPLAGVVLKNEGRERARRGFER